jgi:hypothetical protein
LYLAECGPEFSQVGFGERRQELHQNEVRHAFDGVSVGRGQTRERRCLLVPRQPRLPLGHDDHAPPRPRHRQPREQRGDFGCIATPAALEHESSECEEPRADRRAATATHGPGKTSHLG